MRVRPIAVEVPAEMSTATIFSLMGGWESSPEARGKPELLQGSSVADLRGFYERSLRKTNDFGILVAEDDEGWIRGIATMRMANDSKGKRYGHWVDLYVEPDYRRHGYGRALVHGAERWFADRSAGYLWVECHAANAKALALFMNEQYTCSEPRYGRWWFYILVKRFDLTITTPPT